MQYQSVIRLFEYCNIDCSRVDVGKIKKILAAEFSIVPGGIISIDGFDYTKNDIFRELDREDFAQRLEYHLMIWQNQSLLDCLERYAVDMQELSALEQLTYRGDNQQFAGFISPYFAVAFDKVMRKLLDPVKFKEAATWMKMLSLVDNAEDEHTALSGVRIFMVDFIRLLRNANDVTYRNVLPQLEKWFYQPWPLLINKLPDSFYSDKNDLMNAMVDFIRVILKQNPGLCFKMSSKMIDISGVDPELKAIIASNHKIIRQHYEPANTRDTYRPQSRERGGFSTVLAVLLPIIFLIIRVASVSNHSSSYNHPSPLPQNDIFERIKITPEYVTDLFIKFHKIDTSKYRGLIHKDLMVIGNVPYYMIFEKNRSTSPIIIQIVNSSTTSMAVYQNSNISGTFAVEIKPSNSLQIEGQTNAIGFLLSPAMLLTTHFPPSPILISDSLNFKTHQANLSLPKYVGAVKGSSKVDFTVRVYSKGSDDRRLNCITFEGADWLY